MIISVGINFNEIMYDPMDKDAFNDIGSALVLLLEGGHWNNDSIISVLDEIVGEKSKATHMISICNLS